MDELKPVDLLSLASLIRGAILSAYDATLVGNGAPITKRYSELARAPRVGDLVAELSTAYMRGRSALNSVGVLEEVAYEPISRSYPDIEWDEAEEGRPEPTEPVYYIRTLDGRRYRWHNASLAAAPSDPKLLRGNQAA